MIEDHDDDIFFLASTVKTDNWLKIYSKEDQNTWKWLSFLLHLFYW